ncbi:MAG: hypothetical protein PSV40_15475 [Polaromonas sp.]|uniref:hypothetical protein n=1 Tax=Polaromonas sp. TaxID=1869339 RepID=UPI00248A05A3|nr:hypothetical protein [Polaromonas sp.]MDI1270487.1 hypothetical protein [Polaromonas sp.]
MSTSTNQAAPRQAKRESSILYVVPNEQRSRRSQSFTDYCHGTVIVNDFIFSDMDGNALGLACFVLNIGSLRLHTPTFPGCERKLMASRNPDRDIWNLTGDINPLAMEEGWYLKRAWTALNYAFDKRSDIAEVLEWWSQERLPAVLERIPPALRVNTQFPGLSRKAASVSNDAKY